MRHTQTCDHCRAEIPIFAWVCPKCDVWVGEITRHSADGSQAVRIAG